MVAPVALGVPHPFLESHRLLFWYPIREIALHSELPAGHISTPRPYPQVYCSQPLARTCLPRVRFFELA